MIPSFAIYSCMRSFEPSLFPPVDSRPEIADEDLVSRYREHRDPADFEKLMRRYERELFTFLRRFLGNAQHAEDVFQGTFLSVHLRIDQFEPGKRFRPWLYAIASNKAIDFMRRNKRHQVASLDQGSKLGDSEEAMVQRLSATQEGPDEQAMSNETGARVREAVSQLNAQTQQLIQLAFYQGLKYADIAEILEIPVGTVKSRVFTAVRKLNEIWLRMHEEKRSNSK
ncbi:MAG: sigma-70 family RNA polymerase sigma factor [Pirellula sp.]|nr:sigma-70 family RNA polymerase sigma factor [Pirellula sp.]